MQIVSILSPTRPAAAASSPRSFLSFGLSPFCLTKNVSSIASFQTIQPRLPSPARSPTKSSSRSVLRRLYSGSERWRTSSSTVCGTSSGAGNAASAMRSIWCSTTFVSIRTHSLTCAGIGSKCVAGLR